MQKMKVTHMLLKLKCSFILFSIMEHILIFITVLAVSAESADRVV